MLMLTVLFGSCRITGEHLPVSGDLQAASGVKKGLSTRAAHNCRDFPQQTIGASEMPNDCVVIYKNPEQVHGRCLQAQDVPAPLATKIYYSQRNNRLKSALTHLHHGASVEQRRNNVVIQEVPKNKSMSLEDLSQGGSSQEQVIDLLHKKIPDQILAQNSEMYLGKSGGCPQATNFSNQFQVDNVLRSQSTSVGLTSKYLSKAYSFASNSAWSKGLSLPKRNRTTQTYQLHLGLTSADDGKFLLAAQKCRRATCTDYIVSLRMDDMTKGSSTCLGKLRSNFMRNKFIVYDGQPPHAGAKITRSSSTRLVSLKQVSPRFPCGNYPVAHISYELNVLGSRGPRRMQCIMDAIPASSIERGGVAPTQTEFLLSNTDSFPSIPFFLSKSNHMKKFQSGPLGIQKDGSLVLRNKAPRWHEQLQCWCLNFHGRVTVASVKNFQLVASPENGPAGPDHEKIILQFGKVGKDLFTMDYQYPISAFQAFAICLSSFDTRIACE